MFEKINCSFQIYNFLKKFNPKMFNQAQFYSSWQPTYIFIPNFLGNYIPISFSPLEYKITDVEKGSLFNQNGQLLMQATKAPRIQLIQVQKLTYKAKNNEKSDTDQFRHKNFSQVTEVSVKPINEQKSVTRKRKSCSKLLFDVQWKNQNRNIIPNIMNQMFSFLEKKHKSEWLMVKLFQKYHHSSDCTIPKYFCYMKRMKSSMGHYINQNELQSITKIQQPEFSIYSHEEQLFYLKMSRIAIEYFFRTESILISLTSNRMSQKKRKAHLIARRALLQRVQELFNECSY